MCDVSGLSDVGKKSERPATVGRVVGGGWGTCPDAGYELTRDPESAAGFGRSENWSV